MANHCLLPVYQALFDEAFDYGDFAKRMKMQKAVYLLQDLGMPVGDYGYRWYIHGPYCQELQDDMHDAMHCDPADAEDISDYEAEISKLREAINDPGRGSYDEAQWLECLGSLRYIRKWVLSLRATKEQVLAELVERKKHMNDPQANMAAYACLHRLYKEEGLFKK